MAQVIIPANTKADLSIIINDISINKGKPSEDIQSRFAIHKLNNAYYLSLLATKGPTFSNQLLSDLGIIIGGQINEIITLKVPIEQLNNVHSLPGIRSIQLAGKIKPQLDRAVKDIRADSVHAGIGLPQGYTGKNVFIGITDWGFDYSSPMFYDTLLQNTRIFAAWDQFKTSGPSPDGFSYGTEYLNAQDLHTAGADTANIYSYATHGSHVAGIAGGSGAGTIYRGIAFDANFLLVTFLVDEGAVLDAWEWMYQKAQAESRRLVVNMSWGLYHFGTLDGNSLLSQAIDSYSALGVVFSNSGGNNGDVNFHIKKTFDNDTLRSRIEFYNYSANANMWGQSIHAWGEQGHSFAAGINICDPTGIILKESPFYSTSTTNQYIDTFLVIETDTIWYNISADNAHPQNGRPQMRLRVKCTNVGLRVILKSTATEGIVHFWNVTELSNDVGNWGMPFSFFGSGSTIGDNLYGISEPSCTNSVISVAAYTSGFLTLNGTQGGGNIATFSSIGPRYDEVLKPDIAAPGVSVASSISSYTDNDFTTLTSVDFNGRSYPFARFSGTSMAAPMVTGVAALILEANPYLSSQQVKDIIIQSAREDNKTGVIPENGSTQWGWGKLNAYLAVKLALNTIGLEENDQVIPWSVYPNPVSNELHFTLIDELPSSVQIIDGMGKVITKQLKDSRIQVIDLKSGTYWIRAEVNGHIQQQVFVKQ